MQGRLDEFELGRSLRRFFVEIDDAYPRIGRRGEVVAFAFRAHDDGALRLLVMRGRFVRIVHDAHGHVDRGEGVEHLDARVGLVGRLGHAVLREG